jgi:hypothetical protein
MKYINKEEFQMKAKIVVVMTAFVVFFACAAPNEQGPSPGHGASSAMQGFAHLILSPLQIAAGLLEGIAAVPYFLSTNIHFKKTLTAVPWTALSIGPPRLEKTSGSRNHRPS